MRCLPTSACRSADTSYSAESKTLQDGHVAQLPAQGHVVRVILFWTMLRLERLEGVAALHDARCVDEWMGTGTGMGVGLAMGMGHERGIRGSKQGSGRRDRGGVMVRSGRVGGAVAGAVCGRMESGHVVWGHEEREVQTAKRATSERNARREMREALGEGGWAGRWAWNVVEDDAAQTSDGRHADGRLSVDKRRYRLNCGAEPDSREEAIADRDGEDDPLRSVGSIVRPDRRARRSKRCDASAWVKRLAGIGPLAQLSWCLKRAHTSS